MLANILNCCVDRVTYPKRTDISAVPATQIILRNTMRGVKMKQIQLTQNKFALVDDIDFAELSKHKWCAVKIREVFYAKRSIGKRYNQKTIFMHRQILGAKKGQQIDHRNGNGLDNHKANLRFCTYSQNQQNQQKIRGISQNKGIHWNKEHKKWQAQITLNNHRKHLGYFDNENDAAIAYNRKAVELFGEFANPNLLKVDVCG